MDTTMIPTKTAELCGRVGPGNRVLGGSQLYGKGAVLGVILPLMAKAWLQNRLTAVGVTGMGQQDLSSKFFDHCRRPDFDSKK